MEFEVGDCRGGLSRASINVLGVGECRVAILHREVRVSWVGMHHRVCKVEHYEADHGNCTPCWHCNSKVLIGDVMNTEIVEYTVRYVGPHLIHNKSSGGKYPHKESVIFSLLNLSLFA